MRITECENIRTHLDDDSTHIVLYDCYVSRNEYNTLSFMMSNRNEACKNLCVQVHYAKDVNWISDALKTVIEKSNEYSKFTTLNPYYNASYIYLEHEFIYKVMEYIKLFRPYNMNIPMDIDNYQIVFWQFT